jgi:transcriptional regulator with PAS, ATPase and Fis domain
MGMKSKTVSLDENEKVVDANRRRFDDQIGFSAILEAVNNAIIVIDHQGTIIIMRNQVGEVWASVWTFLPAVMMAASFLVK